MVSSSTNPIAVRAEIIRRLGIYTQSLSLTRAEASWGQLKFDWLIAASQDLKGKSSAETKGGAGAAQDDVDGAVVQQAIAALEAFMKLAQEKMGHVWHSALAG